MDDCTAREITTTLNIGLSIEVYPSIIIIALWSLFGWNESSCCEEFWLDGLADNSVLHCIIQADEVLSPCERFLTRRVHADNQQGPLRWYLTSTTIASHALSSSCRRWVFWAMQRRHQSPMAMPTTERLVVNSFAAASKRRVCCIRQDIRLHQRSRCPIRRERWLKPCRCTNNASSVEIDVRCSVFWLLYRVFSRFSQPWGRSYQFLFDCVRRGGWPWGRSY